MATSTITINSGASTVTLDNTVSVLTLGTSGPQGVPGEGVPVGGTTGQILAKASGTDFDDVWIDNYTTDVRKEVKNDSGGTLAKGAVVYVSGANGANVLVKPAIATADSTSATTIGILAQSLAANGIGWAIVEGSVTGLDTSAATAGDPVWLSGSVAGGVLYGVANKPQAPVHIVYLGTVTRAHSTQGSIEIGISNGWEIDELHNVKITSPSNGQVLTYDSATQLWVNSSETGDISGLTATAPLTGGGTSGNVTVGIDQTALSIAESQVVNLVTDLAAKAPLASPALTGVPTVPTATADTNTTQAASTAFVVGQASSTNPVASGAAAVGVSLKYARADHAHPLVSPGITQIASSYWGVPCGLGTPASNSGLPGNNDVYMMPFTVAETVTAKSVSCEVTTAGQAGSLLRLGIYSADGTSGMAGTLKYDFGTVAADTTGIKTATYATGISLTPGLYWAAVGVQSAATTQPQMRGWFDSGFAFGVPAAAVNVSNGAGSIRYTGVSGAFASNPTFAIGNQSHRRSIAVKIGL